MIVNLPSVIGHLDDGTVTLTCDVRGFLRLATPPMWLNNNAGSPIDSSCPLKYRVNFSNFTSQLPSNGSIVVHILRSTLTINQLEVGDEGQYTCMIEGESSVAVLLIQRSQENRSNPNPTMPGEFIDYMVSILMMHTHAQ